MSTLTRAWAFHGAETQNLRGNTFIALIALADIADDEGYVIFAKVGERDQKALAKKARQSVASFRRSTHVLRDLGLIEISRPSSTSENSYRLLMTSAQSDLWTTPDTTAQNERSHRSERALAPLSSERSHRSTVSAHKKVFNVTTNPPTPAERGSSIQPNDEVLGLLAGQPLATSRTRVCTSHARQRRSCFDCWRVGPLSRDDVPWCGDGDCDKRTRLRHIMSEGRIVATRCPECHPLAIAPERVAEIRASLEVVQ